jgi:ribosomal protein S13
VARISGVDIPREKRLEISLTYIFGVGRTTAQQICAATEIDPSSSIDLKGFTDDFYRHVAMGELAPVLDTLRYLSTTPT